MEIMGKSFMLCKNRYLHLVAIFSYSVVLVRLDGLGLWRAHPQQDWVLHKTYFNKLLTWQEVRETSEAGGCWGRSVGMGAWGKV